MRNRLANNARACFKRWHREPYGKLKIAMHERGFAVSEEGTERKVQGIIRKNQRLHVMNVSEGGNWWLTRLTVQELDKQ
jgi:hypothetical protein